MKNSKYSLVWHFVDTSITVTYDSEEERDESYKHICNCIHRGEKFFAEDDIMLNAGQVQFITKGTNVWEQPEYRVKN